MRELGKYSKSYRKQVIPGPTFKLTEAIFELIIPIVTARIIDEGARRGDIAHVWKMGGIMPLLGAVGLCFVLVCQKMATMVSQGFGTVSRGELFYHISTLFYAEFDRFDTPSLITRLMDDVDQFQLAVVMLIRLAVRALLLAVGAVIMAMTIDVPLTLIFVVATPLIGLALYLAISRSVSFFKTTRKKLDAISRLSQESLSGVRVIYAFSRQEQETERFTNVADEQVAAAIRVGKLFALLNPIMFAIINSSILAIVWYGGLRVDTGTVIQGQIVALINYMNQTLLALVVIVNLVVVSTKASASVARANKMLHTETTVQESDSAAEPQPVSGASKVEFRGVSFSYHLPGEYALQDCSVAIAAGETIGVIGGTGPGKSALVNPIPRSYDITKGQVLLDEVDVWEYPFAVLHSWVGIVLQQSELFTGTIRSNLQWGNAVATDEELWQALKTAQAEDFARALSEDLSSPVSQGGKNYSGGQRQHLAIARALAVNPQVLTLDSSSSTLDLAIDVALRRALCNDTAGMTVLIASQRVSSTRHVDCITVLDDGVVVSIGTHEELIRSCSVCQETCLSQMNREEVAR